MRNRLLTPTDHLRLELALPARLLYEAAYALPPGVSSRNVILEDLLTACREPFLSDLESSISRPRRDIRRPFIKLNTLTTRILATSMEGLTAAKLVMSVFYMLEALISEEILELYASSAMARAVDRLNAIFAASYEDAELDSWAQGQAARLLEACRRRIRT